MSKILAKAKPLKHKLEVGICHYGEHGRTFCELLSCIFVMAETRILLFAAVALIWLVLDLAVLLQKIDEHHEKAHRKQAAVKAMAAGR